MLHKGRSSMKFSFRPMILTAMAFGLATSAVAQEAPPAPSPNPETSQPAPVETPPPAPVETPPAGDAAEDGTPAAEAPAAPAMPAEQYMGVPEYMLNLDLSTGGRVEIGRAHV